MNLIIRNLQIIQSPEFDPKRIVPEIRVLQNSEEFSKPTKRSVENALLFKHSIKFQTNNGFIYAIEGFLFNDRKELVGTPGYLNGNITALLNINKFRGEREFIINGEKVCFKFIEKLVRYGPNVISTLSNSLFTNLVQSPVDIVTLNQEEKLQLIENYLLDNIGKVSNLDLLYEANREAEFTEELPF